MNETLELNLQKELEEIIGSENVFFDEDSLNIYSKDYTENLSFPPDVIVKPINSEQVSRVVKFANENLIPVIPRGGGTGLSGGALPINGGICLSMEKFNKILEIDKENMQATVEPGVITQIFQEECINHNLFYPPDPASRGSCTLGGNLAECAGGPRAVKYGVTKDYVLGIEFVSPTGEIIQTGAKVLKNVSGYNLTQLIIGSEGTLGIITKIFLKLLSYPKQRKVLLAAFNNMEDCLNSVAKIFQSGITPSAIEFMEKSAIDAAERQLGKEFPNKNAGFQLLIEVDGNYIEALDNDIQIIAEVLEQYNVIDIILAEDENKMNELWSLRRCIGEAVKSISEYKEEDTVVPRANIAELLKGVKAITGKYGIDSICYGHAGDGNVHVNILKNKSDIKSWEENLEKAIVEIFELVVNLGGTISGEHGIGYSQKNYLSIALSEEEIGLMKSIKRTLDPNNILNPGKIFNT